MVRSVLKTPNKALKAKSTSVTKFDDTLKKLVRDLMDTMKALGGVGIAAPQIGVTKRVIIVQAPKKSLYVMINPTIEDMRGEEGDSLEGCLSVPGRSGVVKRNLEIQIKYHNIEGEEKRAIALEDEAKIVQHEIGHLNGELFIDVAYKIWKT